MLLSSDVIIIWLLVLAGGGCLLCYGYGKIDYTHIRTLEMQLYV